MIKLINLAVDDGNEAMMMERTTGCEREWSFRLTICSRVMVRTDSFPYDGEEGHLSM